MSATYAVDDQPDGRHPLARGASPAAIRAALLPFDQPAFDADEEALRTARSESDLSGLFRMLEQWRGLAVLQSDEAAYRHSIRPAAELVTGRCPPEGEPLEVTRERANL